MLEQHTSSCSLEHVTQDQRGDDRIVQGPAIGMNSGIRSIGDAIHTTASPSQSLALRGTLGSRKRPRKSTSRLGISVASSRACARRPRRINSMTATNQIAIAMAIPRRRPCTALYKLLARVVLDL